MRPAVITGVGLVTPLGLGAAANWAALCAGEAGVRPLTAFDAEHLPVGIGGEVRGFTPTDHIHDRRVFKTYHRSVHYALAALGLALADAGLDLERVDRTRLGIATGCGEVGPCVTEHLPALRAALGEDGGFDFRRLADRGQHYVDPYLVVKALPTNGLAHASITYQAKGPTFSAASASTAGAQAVGEAMRAIQEGEAEVMLAAGYDSLLLPSVLLHHYKLGLLASGEPDAGGAVRPLDRSRSGYALADGAGAVVLESAEHAARRGVGGLAEVAGYGLGFEPAFPGLEGYEGDRPASGRGTARAIRTALAEAGIAPHEVDVIKVEGEATPAGDRAEWRGVTAALGAAAATTPVCALKGAWGHQGAAAGVTELAAMALGLRRGVVLPTRNFTAPDPDLAVMVAREPTRPPRLRCALVLSRGFGGQSAAIVLRAVADGTRAEETP